MSVPATTTPASRAIEATVEMLIDAGIDATRDAGAFTPQPAGVLVGLPALVTRTMAASVFEVPVLVVSGQPLNRDVNVDRVYDLADRAAYALACVGYRPSSWRSSVNAEPLPAIELIVTVTVAERIEP